MGWWKEEGCRRAHLEILESQVVRRCRAVQAEMLGMSDATAGLHHRYRAVEHKEKKLTVYISGYSDAHFDQLELVQMPFEIANETFKDFDTIWPRL